MPRTEPRTIAFVTYPGMTLLDLVGPITTFLGLTRGLVTASRRFRTVRWRAPRAGRARLRERERWPPRRYPAAAVSERWVR